MSEETKKIKEMADWIIIESKELPIIKKAREIRDMISKLMSRKNGKRIYQKM